MDDRLRICLWMVGGGGVGAVLGCAFGALTAALYARSGGGAGTGWARRLADAFLNAESHQPSPTSRAAFVGALDGFVFLGILGLVGGALLGLSGQSAGELLVPMMVGSLLLVGGAVFFGTLAYALTYYGRECFYGSGGGILGCLLASSLFGSGYGPLGLVPGIIFGLILGRTVRRYSPKFQPPHFENSILRSRSEANSEITEPPPSRTNDEFFPKPDAHEEL
jgi:hypothetical protein